MFGLFKTKPPLVPIEKAWTEARMNWLARHFGADRLLETPTLNPDYEGLPSVSNYDEALGLLDFLRTWMRIKAPNVRLEILSDVVSSDSIAEPDGLDNPTVVSVRDVDFAHRDTLVAALARGLGQEAIAEEGLTEELANDNGWTVELLPAYLGLGAFGANATVEESSYSSGSYVSWSMSRRGLLPSRVFGYAMALRTFVRGDDACSWSSELRQDAKVAFENGMKYLKKTGDTTFCRESITQSPATATVEKLSEGLSNGTPSHQISILWELSDRVNANDIQPDGELGDSVLNCVRSRDPDVRATAVEVLPSFVHSAEVVQEVCDALGDTKPDVRAAAALAARKLSGVDDEPLVEVLVDALRDDSKRVVFNAAHALSRFGEAAEPATKSLIKRMHRAFVDCSDEGILFANTLVSITPSGKEGARAFFDDVEHEFRNYAYETIDELE